MCPRLPPDLFCIAGVSDCSLSLQPPADAGFPLADFSTLKMEAIRSSEMSVNPGPTQRHIPEDDILQGKLHFPVPGIEVEDGGCPVYVPM
jgi:hypothetical protein